MKVVAQVIFNRIPEITARMQNRTIQVVEETAGKIETDIKDRMQASGSGRMYKRGSREHQASAPGEAPAVDYGALIASIQVDKLAPAHAIVFTNADYAEPLEYGTSRMAARPAWTPAAEIVWPWFLTEMQKIIEGGA